MKMSALVFLWAWLGFQPVAWAKVRVVTTIETLAALAREVGRERVEVRSLSHGYEDPHVVQAKPSLVVTLNRADLLVYVGLDLEAGWLPPLVLQSRNGKIQRGQPGHLDCSTAVKVEDVPSAPADQLRALGDVHPLGNPHYWILPRNALAVAKRMAESLTEVDPSGADAYQKNLADFARRLAARQTEWERRAAPLRGVKIVSYHKSWSYLAGWLGLQELGYIEPKPGVPSSTQHTAQLIGLMKKQGVKLVLEESFYPHNLAKLVADKGGARLAVLPSDVGATPAIRDYFELGDAVITGLLE